MRIKSDKRGWIKKTIPVWQQRFTGELLPKQPPKSQFPADLPTAGLLLSLSWNYSSVSITSKCCFFSTYWWLVSCQKRLISKRDHFSQVTRPQLALFYLQKKASPCKLPTGTEQDVTANTLFLKLAHPLCVLKDLRLRKVPLSHFQHILYLETQLYCKWLIIYLFILFLLFHYRCFWSRRLRRESQRPDDDVAVWVWPLWRPHIPSLLPPAAYAVWNQHRCLGREPSTGLCYTSPAFTRTQGHLEHANISIAHSSTPVARAAC